MKILIVDKDKYFFDLLKNIILKYHLNIKVNLGYHPENITDDEQYNLLFINYDKFINKNIKKRSIRHLIVCYGSDPRDAVEACQLGALRYLLFPTNENTIITLLYRLQNYWSFKNQNRIPRIPIKINQDISFIDWQLILFVKKLNSESQIFTTEKKYSTNYSISALENMLLPLGSFLRSHRSYIINMRRISKIVPWSKHSYLVKFDRIDEGAYLAISKLDLILKNA